MKSIPLAFAAVLAGLALVLPAAASAQIVELGKTSTPVAAPSCPSGTSPAQCYIILTRTTALQTVSDGVLNPTKVKKPGWIVAFTVGLSNLSSNAKTELSYLHTLDSAYGGVPQVALSVLKPGRKNKYTVVAESGAYHLIPFLGQVLQEPLSLPPSFSTFTALPVKRGDVVGLTVPTWAPVLSYNLSSSKFAYRQSRRANCKNAAAGETAQLKVGQSTQYRCNYTGTRVEYTATEIVNQPYPKKYVHSRRKR
ncbi:MAG TPA: hypothetical protein VE127_08180 [Solirubrobacteraceae bacterium]|nr:hypothetical protein [Solirubrobacteraceae bacterium]